MEVAPASTHHLAVAALGPASVTIVHGHVRFGVPLDGVSTMTISGLITTPTVEGKFRRGEHNVE
ncbi:MAG: hypothetical protein GY925_26095 [Actinomycetia bacterium]|nr:hypothetical protein [Actinomycetes bacterium]